MWASNASGRGLSRDFHSWAVLLHFMGLLIFFIVFLIFTSNVENCPSTEQCRALGGTMQSQNFTRLWPFWNFFIQVPFVLTVDVKENLKYGHLAEACSLIRIMLFHNSRF